MLSKDIRSLKLMQVGVGVSAPADNSDKKNNTPTPKKKANVQYNWTDGLKWDKRWTVHMKSWYLREFKKNNIERWKKWRLGRPPSARINWDIGK